MNYKPSSADQGTGQGGKSKEDQTDMEVQDHLIPQTLEVIP